MGGMADEERLSIVGVKRPPQFYMPSYEAKIPESQKKDSDIISVKAKSFANREIRWTLKAQGQGAGTFNIGPSSGIVKLAKELDFEDLRQPHIYQLLVTATEDSGGFSNSVELNIRVSDVNDNAPKFELPDYQAHSIDEDITIGTSILKVKASDADIGSYADIAYSVSDDHSASFSVSSVALPQLGSFNSSTAVTILPLMESPQWEMASLANDLLEKSFLFTRVKTLAK